MYEELYSAYTQDSIMMATPMRLVVALYEGALGAVQSARHCLAAEQIMERSKAVSKAVEILAELIASLDREKGGELSARLHKLYSYMQQRVLEAHMRQADAPLAEVESLLTTLLDGWRQAAAKLEAAAPAQSASYGDTDPAPCSFAETF